VEGRQEGLRDGRQMAAAAAESEGRERGRGSGGGVGEGGCRGGYRWPNRLLDPSPTLRRYGGLLCRAEVAA
jgi:hypothetical protein